MESPWGYFRGIEKTYFQMLQFRNQTWKIIEANIEEPNRFEIINLFKDLHDKFETYKQKV